MLWCDTLNHIHSIQYKKCWVTKLLQCRLCCLWKWTWVCLKSCRHQVTPGLTLPLWHHVIPGLTPHFSCVISITQSELPMGLPEKAFTIYYLFVHMLRAVKCLFLPVVFCLYPIMRMLMCLLLQTRICNLIYNLLFMQYYWASMYLHCLNLEVN